MQFSYEISADEFVAAQIALHTAKNKRRLIKRALGYTLLGVVFGLSALFRYPDLGPLLLLLVAAHFICVGITNLFPQRYFRRHIHYLNWKARVIKPNSMKADSW
jgi:hypothetical protein